MLKGLYAVTDATLTPDATLLKQVEQAILGGVSVVQLRDKTRSDAALLPLAAALQDLCRQHKTCLIINDRLDLAQQIDADGLHIGQYDVEFNLARQRFPNKIIGVSCYADLAKAAYFQQQGADYVAFGAFFQSPTKPQAPLAPITLVTDAKQCLKIPVCAIGGIGLATAASLIEQGADLLAVISDLWRSPDIQQQAQHYSDLFNR